MSLASWVSRRVDRKPSMIVLAAGDLLAIGAFAVAGRISHGDAPKEALSNAVDPFIQFTIGLAIVGLVGSLYTTDALRSPARAVTQIVPAWIGAVLVAQAFRATPVVPGNAALTFAAVAVVIGGVFLVVWRAIAAFLLS